MIFAIFSHLYLNSKSSHPRHVIKNIPKGQFVRVRRICSEIEDFDQSVKDLKKYFMERGYKETELQNSIKPFKHQLMTIAGNEARLLVLIATK